MIMKRLTGRATPAEQRNGTIHTGKVRCEKELRKLKEACMDES